MKIQTVYIYTLADPRTEKVRYVGKTHDLRNRLWQHVNQPLAVNAALQAGRLAWLEDRA
jgi:hypothetical protein